MTALKRYSVKELSGFASRLLEALDVPPDDARISADCLVMAHLRGFDTHGLPCLPGYVECLMEGRIKARPKITVEKTQLWSYRLDADNGLGQVGASMAMNLALESARQMGIGGAVVRRSNHFGAASAYSMMALEHDCLSIVTSNASTATAPFGSAEAFSGTNPLSVAVPAGEMPPFVIDMATSEGARKKVRLALEKGESIPTGWALDEKGDPTTDPARALQGVMLPFGGMKGSAINMLLDILSGVMSGAGFGGDVLNVYTNQERESNNGHFFLVFKVASFMDVEEFKTRMDEDLNRVRSLKPIEGFPEVIYPGYRENQIQGERLVNGVPLDDALIDRLLVTGKKLGVQALW